MAGVNATANVTANATVNATINAVQNATVKGISSIINSKLIPPDFLSRMWVLVLCILFLILVLYFLIKVFIVRRSIRKVCNNLTEDNISQNRFLSDIWRLYKQSFIKIGKGGKTEEYAEDYFGDSLIESILNVELWRSVSGIFVALGILGTFVGLCVALPPISKDIGRNDISKMVNGARTAFYTSLYGIAFSIIFGFIKNIGFHYVHKTISQLCHLLNDKYKLTRMDVVKIDRANHDRMIEKIDALSERRHLEIKELIKSELEETREKIIEYIAASLEKLFVSQDSEDRELYPSNMLRDILRESEQQSQALKSFSTDLADVIIDKMEEMSARSIAPEFQKIIASLEALKSTIESFTSKAGENMGSELREVVLSLQENLNRIVSDFSETFSSGAVQQLNRVIEALNRSAEVIEGIPEFLDKTVKEIGESSAIEMEKRREELSNEFESLKNNLKDAITGLIEQLSRAEEKQIEREQSILNQINQSLESSVKRVEDLILIQESYTNQITELFSSTKSLVEEEKDLLQHLSENNRLLVNISQSLRSTADNLERNSGNLEKVMSDINSSIQLLKSEFEKLENFNSQILTQIQSAFRENRELIEEYTRKFEIIREGLKEIFSEIESGLERYSSTVKDSINEYLAGFTNQLANAAEKLAGSIEALNDLFEEIADKLEK